MDPFDEIIDACEWFLDTKPKIDEDQNLMDLIKKHTQQAQHLDHKVKTIDEYQQESQISKTFIQLVSSTLEEVSQLIGHVRDRYTNNSRIKNRLNETLHYFDMLSKLFITILEIFDEKSNIQKLEHPDFNIKANTIDEMNLFGLNDMLHILSQDIFSHFIRIGQTFTSGDIKNDAAKLVKELKVYNSHLRLIARSVASAVDFSKSDLLCLNRTHPRWLQICSLRKQVKLGRSAEEIQLSYFNFMKTIRIGHAVMMKSNHFKSPILKYSAFVLSAAWYFLFNKRCVERATQHICDLKVNSAMEVMNLVEKPGIKHMMQLAISPIKVNFKIYINPVVVPLTMQYMVNEEMKGTLNSITGQNVEYINNYEQDIFTKDKSKLRIRILCSGQIVRLNDYNRTYNFDTVLIHIHGGGFISMSSGSHQNYTREWANNLNIPIFSIDYALAPKYPFPHGLDDIWQAYHWILNYCSKYFNIVPKKVILAGDSAGGNLICALTGLCIKFGVRIPDGLLISYPVMDVHMKYSPSHVLGIKDYLLSHTVMDICIDAYTQDKRCKTTNPFRSPYYFSDEIYAKFPPSRILVGTHDPLYDQSMRLLDQLIKVGCDVKMNEYEGMSHGFLSFYLKLAGMKEAEQTIVDSLAFLRELIKGK